MVGISRVAAHGWLVGWFIFGFHIDNDRAIFNNRDKWNFIIQQYLRVSPEQ